WQRVLSLIQAKLSKPSFETWFKSTRARFYPDQNLIVVSAPTVFAAEWLETRYIRHIARALDEVLGFEPEVRFTVEDGADAEPPAVRPQPPAYKAPAVSPVEHAAPMLNPKYTFETFVIGGANRFAHAASLAVAEAPAKAYNPLFLYGGVGLGKT